MASKAPITCHVLDTIPGKPAAHMNVQLICTSQANPCIYQEKTNADGRITNWTSENMAADGQPPVPTVQEVFDGEGEAIWELKFFTEEYYGEGNTFWPTVTLTFKVKPGQHFHVPLLLGPYSYTTYRGS